MVIIIGVYYGISKNEVKAPVTSESSQNSQPATTTASSQATSQPVEAETYVNTEHQFQFQYTSDWKPTDIFNLGLDAGAIAFVKADQESKLQAEIQPTPASIKKAAADNALFVRIVKSSSINNTISSLYGSGVAVSSADVNGYNITHIVQSKSTDPVNWSGGSTESYIFRNSLGEAIVVEANYSTAEPQTGTTPAGTDLKKALDRAIQTLVLKATQVK